MASEFNVLVTGAEGQLGKSLRKTLPAEIKVNFINKAGLNLENGDAVAAWFAQHKVDVIINAAAYTKVDHAEKEREAAFGANEAAVRNIAAAARKSGSYLIHISTDFLFHGAFNRPIDEMQKIQPLGIYAQSKAAGEQALVNENIPSAIVRTSWLYSEFNTNFMKTMIRLGREKPELKVVADQHGSPTYAVDLARGLWQMVAHRRNKPVRTAATEIYHFSNQGVTTWYDFSTAILGIAGIRTPVEPILTEEYPLPTPRPIYSALWPRKFAKEFQFPMRHWRTALVEAVNALKVSEGAFL
jgi:dTDP-4-dehydrorhamnose reductase